MGRGPFKQWRQAMKKATVLGAALVAALTFGAQSAGAILLCDNFGRTWDLAISGDTLSGIRDTQDDLLCGGLFTHGMYGSSFGGTHFVVTSMEGNGNCRAVIWDGIWTGTSGSGTWFANNGIESGAFSLTQGACPLSSAAASGDDPSK